MRAFPAAATAVLLAVGLGLSGCADRGPSPSSRPSDRATASAGTPGTSQPNQATPAASLPRPDGLLAYSTDDPGPTDDIFTLDLGVIGAAPSRLTLGPEKEFDPDLSPDGRSIVFRVNPDPSSDHADLWLMDRDGSGVRNLTSRPELDNWSPAWSPDGTRIAFASTREGGTLRLWTIAADGGDPRPVTRGHGEYPDWSPDGERLVYAAPHDGGGPYDLWIVDAAGATEPIAIVAATGSQFAPAWSPDGAWIAYQSEVGQRWEAWIVRPDGSDARRVSPAGEDGAWPAWSPGGLLAWSGPRGVHVLDPETGATSTVAVPGGASFLSWGR